MEFPAEEYPQSKGPSAVSTKNGAWEGAALCVQGRNGNCYFKGA